LLLLLLLLLYLLLLVQLSVSHLLRQGVQVIL
jgi:hypothetical protein